MNINRENYEAFLLDYHDGALTEAQMEELMDFLSQNPDLKEEFESFELIMLDEVPEERIPMRELLKKNNTGVEITANNFEEYCIAMVENELDEMQEMAFEAFIKDKPELQKVYGLYKNTLLSPETEIFFQNTASLKRFSVYQDAIPTTYLPSLETILIAYLEGDLNDEEKLAVPDLVLHNGKIAGEYALLKSTQLKTDPEIIFPFKSSLKRHKTTTGFRQVWYYAAAAALAAFMFSLYFLWQPTEDTPQYAGNNSGIINRGIEPQLHPLQQSNTPVMPLVPGVTTVKKEPVSIARSELVELSALNDTQMINRALPPPSFVAQMIPNISNSLGLMVNIPTIKQRTEFAYWPVKPFNNYDDAGAVSEPIQTLRMQNQISLTNLAFTGIERSTGIDLQIIEQTIANKDLTFWDFAGASLAGISQLTGRSLTVDKERDPNGRIIYLAIGENFSIKR